MAKRDSAAQSALAELRSLIATTYSVGDQLPNEKQLAEKLDVSRGTVREALGVLSTEGVVTRAWGVGTFVSPPRPAASLNMSAIQSYRDRVQAGGRVVSLRDSSCSREVPNDRALSALGLPAATEAWRVYRLFAVDGVPSAYMVEYIPTSLGGVDIDPTAMMSIDTDLFDMLNRHHAGIVAKIVTDVEAIVISGPRATALGVPDGEPVLQSEQVTLNSNDEPLAYGTTLQRTDLVRMRITR